MISPFHYLSSKAHSLSIDVFFSDAKQEEKTNFRWHSFWFSSRYFCALYFVTSKEKDVDVRHFISCHLAFRYRLSSIKWCANRSHCLNNPVRTRNRIDNVCWLITRHEILDRSILHSVVSMMTTSNWNICRSMCIRISIFWTTPSRNFRRDGVSVSTKWFYHRLRKTSIVTGNQHNVWKDVRPIGNRSTILKQRAPLLQLSLSWLRVERELKYRSPYRWYETMKQ